MRFQGFHQVPSVHNGERAEALVPGPLIPIALGTLATVSALWLLTAEPALAMLTVPLLVVCGALGLIMLELSRLLAGDNWHTADVDAREQRASAIVLEHPALSRPRSQSGDRLAA
jgi:hypothetical protein